MVSSEPPKHGYRVPRVTFYLGRWIRTTDFYPDFQTRLYDRRSARWRGTCVHESVAVDGPVGQLRHDLEHYSFRDLRDHLDRVNHYTTLAARQMNEAGRRAGPLDLFVHPPAAFLRNYLLRRGILDGALGVPEVAEALGNATKHVKTQNPKPKTQNPKPKSQTLTKDPARIGVFSPHRHRSRMAWRT